MLNPHDPLAIDLRRSIGDRIDTFIARQTRELDPLLPDLEPLFAAAQQALSGGKRLRAAFCVWGYVAAAGLPADLADPPFVPQPARTSADAERLRAVLTAAASLELLHSSALVHDDVMDASDTRRGAPAAHRQFSDTHSRQAWLGDPDSFGRAGAILLGDLLVMWSVELLGECWRIPDTEGHELEQIRRSPSLLWPPDRRFTAERIAQLMRTEVTCGQFLDVAAQASPFGTDLAHALAAANQVVEYKSARYTVYRPAQLGAALGGASPELLSALAAYGSPLGRAFQFRDDLLGVFGDPELTGKPVGDDLREGKRTVLVAYAMEHADPAGQRLLASRLGDPDLDATGVEALQEVIETSGAHQATEKMISDCHDQAVAALAEPSITEPGRIALTALADAAVRRKS